MDYDEWFKEFTDDRVDPEDMQNFITRKYVDLGEKSKEKVKEE